MFLWFSYGLLVNINPHGIPSGCIAVKPFCQVNEFLYEAQQAGCLECNDETARSMGEDTPMFRMEKP